MKYLGFFSLLCSIGLSQNVLADYITDDLMAAVRTGPSYEYRIIKYLPTGKWVTTGNSSSDDKWVEVITDDIKGWTLKQYISPSKPAKMRLEVAQSKISELEAKINTFKEQLKVLENSHQGSSAERDSLKIELTQLRKRYDELKFTAEHAVEIQEKLNSLQYDHERLKLESDRLMTENHSLKNSQLIKGIQWGLIAVSLGVLLALFSPKFLNTRKKSSW